MLDVKNAVYERIKIDTEKNGFFVAKGVCYELGIPYAKLLDIVRILVDEGKVEKTCVKSGNSLLNCFKSI